MPTGYTYNVVDGTVSDFSTFAKQCARAFGALIDMRDEPQSAAWPTDAVPDTRYFDVLIAELGKSLARLEAMTPEQIEVERSEQTAAAEKTRLEYIAGKKEEDDRISIMLGMVDAWEPPTPDHVKIKTFMRQQLEVSLNGDVSRYLDPITHESPREWAAKEKARLQRDIERQKQERADEIARAASRTAWRRALINSLETKSAKQVGL